MKSKIRIDLDQNNTPVILIDYVKSLDETGRQDIRDSIVQRFIDGFGYDSNIARVHFSDNDQTSIKTISITPIHFDLIVKFEKEIIENQVKAFIVGSKLIDASKDEQFENKIRESFLFMFRCGINAAQGNIISPTESR